MADGARRSQRDRQRCRSRTIRARRSTRVLRRPARPMLVSKCDGDRRSSVGVLNFGGSHPGCFRRRQPGGRQTRPAHGRHRDRIRCDRRSGGQSRRLPGFDAAVRRLRSIGSFHFGLNHVEQGAPRRDCLRFLPTKTRLAGRSRELPERHSRRLRNSDELVPNLRPKTSVLRVGLCCGNREHHGQTHQDPRRLHPSTVRRCRHRSGFGYQAFKAIPASGRM